MDVGVGVDGAGDDVGEAGAGSSRRSKGFAPEGGGEARGGEARGGPLRLGLGAGKASEAEAEAEASGRFMYWTLIQPS